MQARFLLAKLNPSRTHTDLSQGNAGTGDVIVTEDVSFDAFLHQLQKLAVSGV